MTYRFKDPRLVIICAFRYALGRATYMPSVIADELIANWNELSEYDRKQIQEDIRQAIEHGLAGMDCDAIVWKRILEL